MNRKLITIALFAVTVPAAACVATDEETTGTVDPDVAAIQDTAAAERAANGCTKQQVFVDLAELDAGEAALATPVGPTTVGRPDLAGKDTGRYGEFDLYFHPNNGAHGAWIQSYRLCRIGTAANGANNYQICTGGSAPARFWNTSTCGGSVQDYYPQGWTGWATQAGGCF